MPNINIAPTPTALHQQVAEWIIQQAQRCLQQHDRFTLALSGGTTPLPIYALLAQPPYRTAIAWDKVHVFFVDERAVPPDQPESNYFNIHQICLQHLPAQVHRIEAEHGSEEAAIRYGRMLKLFFEGGGTVFDVVILGMGKDAHTASLFPHEPALSETHHRVMPSSAPTPPHARVTLTPWVINSAKAIAVVVSGTEKAHTLSTVFQAEQHPQEYPIQLIAPTEGELHWFIDEAASSELNQL